MTEIMVKPVIKIIGASFASFAAPYGIRGDHYPIYVCETTQPGCLPSHKLWRVIRRQPSLLMTSFWETAIIPFYFILSGMTGACHSYHLVLCYKAISPSWIEPQSSCLLFRKLKYVNILAGFYKIAHFFLFIMGVLYSKWLWKWLYKTSKVIRS